MTHALIVDDDVDSAEMLATLLSGKATIAGHRPWPRYDVDAATWDAVGAMLASGEGILLGLWGDVGAVHLALNAPSSAASCSRSW